MQIEGETSGQVALPGLWANFGQLDLWQFVGPEYNKFVLQYLLRLGCVKLTVNIMAHRCRERKNCHQQ